MNHLTGVHDAARDIIPIRTQVYFCDGRNCITGGIGSIYKQLRAAYPMHNLTLIPHRSDHSRLHPSWSLYRLSWVVQTRNWTWNGSRASWGSPDPEPLSPFGSTEHQIKGVINRSERIITKLNCLLSDCGSVPNPTGFLTGRNIQKVHPCVNPCTQRGSNMGCKLHVQRVHNPG